MTPQRQQPATGQIADNNRSSSGRKKRLSQILPELRERIPGLFDKDVPAERLAEQFSINKTEILEEMIRDTRRALGRKGPHSERFVVLQGRRSA